MSTVQRKEEFIRLLASTERKGMPSFLAWLAGTEFYTQPASSVYHSNYEGGLLEHSLTVYAAMTWVTKAMSRFNNNTG
jgi:23S rRNA maturation-related 3'-5' exoribonuclease YhaM